MPAFLYFAYGSNMSSARLRERCPSAEPCGTAAAPGFSLRFDKHSVKDGSGKATLTKSEGAEAMGVLYRIDITELAALDEAESGYDRLDDFAVRDIASGAPIRISTYIAKNAYRRAGLKPYDWYLGLILAGARENALAASYIEKLAAIPVVPDPDRLRAEAMRSVVRLTEAGTQHLAKSVSQ